MRTLSLDLETYSSHDLTKTGVYKYAEAIDFEILLCAYSFDDEPVEIIDFSNYETLPDKVFNALTDPSILKTCWNCNFEITCLNKWFNIKLDAAQFEDSMIKSAMLGLPMSLGAASKVLHLEQEKDSKGKALIRYFSVPCKPSIKNGGRTRNMPEHDPVKWQQYKDYCVKDVEVEQAIREKISWFKIPENEKLLWQLDQRINDEGVLLDPILVKNAIEMDRVVKDKLTTEAIQLTGLSNPNSAAQLKEWLSKEMDEEVTKLTKTDIPELLKSTDDVAVSRVLSIRQEMSKTSVKKYAAMMNAICKDDRARGLFQFGGASRTFRFSGRLIQVQNLPQNHLKDLSLARQLVREGDVEMVEMLFGNVPDTLSQLIRTAFVPPEGKKFIVVDFSSIELIVAAWLADEKWVLAEYVGERKIYEQTAARMLKIPVDKVDKPARQKGKIASLACQYGGSVGALVKMGAVKMGLIEEELQSIVDLWRAANKNIVLYWKTLEKAAKQSVRDNVRVKIKPGLEFFVEHDILFIQLPSGRRLSYQSPRLQPGSYGDYLSYAGTNQTTKQWMREDTYGGKIFENLCQAVARDCLAVAMLNLEAKGYKTVMHVHDECVVEECNDGIRGLEEVIPIMTQPIPWAKGLPLAADGFETKYYKKD